MRSLGEKGGPEGRDDTIVAAVIPVFRAPDELPARVAELRTEVDHVVLVDDGSSSLRTLSFSPDGTHVIELPRNAGIAHALNVGVARARELGATYVLTLDQDSRIASGYVDAALGVFTAGSGLAGGIAAAVPESVGGQTVLTTDDPAVPFDPIQSGQVLPIAVIDDIGPFDEGLFIDAVDSEFTLRARRAGYEFAIVPHSSVEHSLGELVPITFLGRRLVLRGRPRSVLYHAPFRSYYMVRNSIWIYRAYRGRPRGWHLRRSARLSSMLLGCIMLAPDRMAQFIAITHGWRDGIGGRLGRIPSKTETAIARWAADRR